MNLTGARTPADRARMLVAPVLPAQSLPEAGTLLDVGSGNGSPGLVLALLREDLEVTLLEPRTRRWAFLREAARRAGGPPVRVLRGRHDEFPGPPARTVTLRALALPLTALAPLVETGGRVVFLGGSPVLQGPFEEQDMAGDARVFRRLPDGVSRGTPGSPEGP
jgi:16S rRNA G527 N7-methylase RsmG